MSSGPGGMQPPPPFGGTPPLPAFPYPYSPPPQGYQGGPPWSPAPPQKKRKSKALKVSLIVVAVVLLAVTMLVGTVSQGSEDFHDANAEAEVHHTVNYSINTIRDAPPFGASQEQWDGFWSEPAMNTATVRRLLGYVAESWDRRLASEQESMELLLGSISDTDRRANAQTSVDMLSDAREGGLKDSGKRRIYEELVPVFREACLGRTGGKVDYDPAGRPSLNIDTYARSIWSEDENGQEIRDLMDQSYPAMFEAGLKYHCDSPYPPLPATEFQPADAEAARTVAEQVDRLLSINTRYPSGADSMLPEDREAIWDLPALQTPDATAYIERLGERAINQQQREIATYQGQVDQIQDETLRAHTQVYLDYLSDEVERKGVRAFGMDLLFDDISGFWRATCEAESSLNIGGFSKVGFDFFTKKPEPRFNSATIDTADIGEYEPGDKEWAEKSLEMAMKVYPDAYWDGLKLYCE